MTIEVSRTTGAWALKVNTGKPGVDPLTLQGNTSRTGLYRLVLNTGDLPAGKTALRIYAVGQAKSVWVRSLQVWQPAGRANGQLPIARVELMPNMPEPGLRFCTIIPMRNGAP